MSRWPKKEYDCAVCGYPAHKKGVLVKKHHLCQGCYTTQITIYKGIEREWELYHEVYENGKGTDYTETVSRKKQITSRLLYYAVMWIT